MSFLRWMFEDRRTGRIVVGQKPNLLMGVFLVATAARYAAPRGTAYEAVRWTQAGSLFLWALDELLRGVNPFRRIGGAAVLAAMPFLGMIP